MDDTFTKEEKYLIKLNAKRYIENLNILILEILWCEGRKGKLTDLYKKLGVGGKRQFLNTKTYLLKFDVKETALKKQQIEEEERLISNSAFSSDINKCMEAHTKDLLNCTVLRNDLLCDDIKNRRIYERYIYILREKIRLDKVKRDPYKRSDAEREETALSEKLLKYINVDTKAAENLNLSNCEGQYKRIIYGMVIKDFYTMRVFNFPSTRYERVIYYFKFGERPDLDAYNSFIGALVERINIRTFERSIAQIESEFREKNKDKTELEINEAWTERLGNILLALEEQEAVVKSKMAFLRLRKKEIKKELDKQKE